MSPSSQAEKEKAEIQEGVGLESATEIGGSWVIGSILALGLAAAAFAWLFQHYQTDEALAFWGSDAAHRIRVAERVELLSLVPADDPKSIEKLSGGEFAIGVADRRDLSQAHGLTHARQALLQDASYRFDNPPANCASPFTLGVQFTAEGQTTTLLLDLACPRVRHLESGREARLGERLAEGLTKFLKEQLEEKKK